MQRTNFWLLAGCSAVLLAACSVDRQPPPDGAFLSVLLPDSGAAATSLPGSWFVGGLGGAKGPRVSLAERDGVPAVRLEGGSRDLIVARHISTVLVAAPFLSWAWNVSPGSGDVHPAHVVVGFHSGQAHDAAAAPWPWQTPLPLHDRLMVFTWHRSALRRGTLKVDAEYPGRAWLTARGGWESADSWWLETFDLSDLYATAWPADDPNPVTVAFLGAWVSTLINDDGPRPSALISGLILSR